MGRKSQKITVVEFAGAVEGILNEFAGDVNKVTDEALIKVANETRKLLRSTSPKAKGKGASKYSRGWKYKLEKPTGGRHYVVVYNGGSQKSLAHLLEKGHANHWGGFVPGKPHIAPAGDTARKEFLKLVEQGINKL